MNFDISTSSVSLSSTVQWFEHSNHVTQPLGKGELGSELIVFTAKVIDGNTIGFDFDGNIARNDVGIKFEVVCGAKKG